jgi:hypothetical protein
MEMNIYIFFVAAIIPLVIGFIWYGLLFRNTWMKEKGFTKESLASQNMVLTFILSYVFSLLISFFLLFLVVHQMGVMQVLQGETGFKENTGEAFTLFQNFLGTYGDRFRTFKHGAAHGTISGAIFVFPVLSIIGLFERESVKYVAIKAGYWIVTLAIMGGIICQWV